MRFGRPTKPAIDAMLMILPLPALIM